MSGILAHRELRSQRGILRRPDRGIPTYQTAGANTALRPWRRPLRAAALVKAVLEGLKIDPPFFSGQASQLFFKTIPELNRKPVVIIDDAQDLAATALTAIKGMVNFHFDSRTAITFVLAGQPELRELLKYSAFAAVRQRIRISYHMPPLSLQETCSYIDHHTAPLRPPHLDLRR